MSLFTDSDRQRWDAYAQASRDASCYHQSGWKEVIERSFGHRTFYLLSEDDFGAVDGILPLIQINSRIFGNYLISLPYFNYGGVCASTRRSYDCLLQQAKHVATETNAAHLELRHTANIDPDLPVKIGKVAMRLELPDGAGTLLKSFPSKLRSQINRPRKEGLIARIGRGDELDAFYAVFAHNMRDLGTPVYGRSFFRNILETFPETTWICTIRTRDGLPVAAGLLVAYKGTMEIPWASSLRRYNPLSPNMLLYCSVLEFACNQGCHTFDFGRSTPGEGTYRFKEQWGAKPLQLYWHYWMRNGGALPELNPRNPKYRLAIRIWQKLPVAITRVLGPSIVKNLP